MGRMYYESYRVNVSSRKNPISFEKLLMYDMEDISKMFGLSINTVADNLNGVEEDGLVRYAQTPHVDTKLWSGVTLKNLIKQGKFFNSVPLNTIFYKNYPSYDGRLVYQTRKNKGSSYGYRDSKYEDTRKVSELKENSVTITQVW